MSMTLMYITNNPVVAQIAQKSGVDRIWLDMEYIGKEQRQPCMDTVKNHHTIEDIQNIRPIITTSQVMVRVNPLHQATKDYCSSKEEIDNAIKSGADVVMLPMFRTRKDAEQFIEYVDGRATVQLLVETKEANENIDDILKAEGIDEIHIGLNDLHLAYKMKFMFELLCDGTVSRLCKKFKDKGLKYGFGGIARVGYGMLPAEYVIAEHYALGSTRAILSRGFCNANNVSNPAEIEDIFIDGVRNIRLKELEVARFTQEQYNANKLVIKDRVEKIISDK